MRRILVPLDGSAFAESILPDARRYAGPDGILVLARNAREDQDSDKPGTYTHGTSSQQVHAYLQGIAGRLQAEGGKTETAFMRTRDAPSSITLAVGLFHVDMIACATHGEGPEGRLLWGSVVWEALVRSRVPVLLRLADDSGRCGVALPTRRRKIMVPLDGSAFAEMALPVAQEFASEWNASLLLVSVTPGDVIVPYPEVVPMPDALRERMASTRSYLERLADRPPGGVETEVLDDESVVYALDKVVKEKMVTDVMLVSHGHGDCSRVVGGSVADGLIHDLHCPIVVIPATATQFLPASRETVKAVAPVS